MRPYWLEITIGDLRGQPVEGPYFQTVGAALRYVRRLCERIDADKLRGLLWADIVIFQVVAAGGERVWFRVWDDRHHMLVPQA